MRIAAPEISCIADEAQLLAELLPLPGAAVLELGCGKAGKTRSVLLARNA